LELLEPLLLQRNNLHTRWLATGDTSDHKNFAEVCRLAQRAVRAAKNSWYHHKAEEVQRGMFSGKLAWMYIRDIQRCQLGLLPIRSATETC
jgi:hypothetical protein